MSEWADVINQENVTASKWACWWKNPQKNIYSDFEKGVIHDGEDANKDGRKLHLEIRDQRRIQCAIKKEVISDVEVKCHVLPPTCSARAVPCCALHTWKEKWLDPIFHSSRLGYSGTYLTPWLTEEDVAAWAWKLWDGTLFQLPSTAKANDINMTNTITHMRHIIGNQLRGIHSRYNSNLHLMMSYVRRTRRPDVTALSGPDLFQRTPALCPARCPVVYAVG